MRAFVPFGLHQVQERPVLLPDRERDGPSIGGDGWTAEDFRSRAAPKFRGRSVVQPPDALARSI